MLTSSETSSLIAYLVWVLDLPDVQIPFVLSPSLHRVLLLNSISLRPSDALFQFCYECIPVIMIVFSNETVADVARRVRRVLGSIQRRTEGSAYRVKVTHATAKNPFVEDRKRLLKSEILGGCVGDDAVSLSPNVLVFMHPFGESRMEASSIYALPRVDVDQGAIGDCGAKERMFDVLDKYKLSFRSSSAFTITCAINVMCAPSEEDASAMVLKSVDGTSIHQAIQTNMAMELNTMKKRNLNFQRDRPIRLEDCFDFCTVVDSSEVCSFCHQEGKQDLDQRITVLPPILVLLLKRFSYNAATSRTSFMSGYRSKITDLVSFPLDGLDMSSYTISNTPALYDLICVCNHSGTADFGHYYAYCRECDRGQWRWFEYNDDYVRELTAREVQTPNAYILFYRRHDLMATEEGNCACGGELAPRMNLRCDVDLAEQAQLEEDERAAKEMQRREYAESRKQRDIEYSVRMGILHAQEGTNCRRWLMCSKQTIPETASDMHCVFEFCLRPRARLRDIRSCIIHHMPLFL